MGDWVAPMFTVEFEGVLALAMTGRGYDRGGVASRCVCSDAMVCAPIYSDERFILF